MSVSVIDRRSLWQRVIERVTPWSHLTRHVDAADAAVARLTVRQERSHLRANESIRAAYTAIGKRLDRR